MFKAEWDALGRRLGYTSEHEMFDDLYRHQKLSVIDLASRLGVTQGTIARRLKVLKIPTRSRGGNNREGNDFPKRLRLWRFDQRLIFLFHKSAVAPALGVSEVTLQSYKESLCSSVL